MIEQWHYFQNISFPIYYRVGQNENDNIDLVLQSDNDDIWFHASEHSSCHVVLKMPQMYISKKQLFTIIKRGAQICKQSTNRIKNKSNIEITYCKVSQLKIDETSTGTVHIQGNHQNLSV